MWNVQDVPRYTQNKKKIKNFQKNTKQKLIECDNLNQLFAFT